MDFIKEDKLLKHSISKINEHPLKQEELVEIVLGAWEGLLMSKIGNKPSQIGVDIFPKPQLIGSLLHELIAIEFNLMFPSEWRIDKNKNDKDLVYLKDDKYSIEIKTSSSDKQIFGNRSYTKSTNVGKSKDGYFLAVNFDKIQKDMHPKIKLIRFGYLNQTDWIGQKSETGQQCRLSKEACETKLIEIYRIK